MLEWLTDKIEDQSSEDAWKLSVNREITRILGFLDKGGGEEARELSIMTKRQPNPTMVLISLRGSFLWRLHDGDFSKYI